MSDNQGITYGEPHPEPSKKNETKDFVVVLAYRSDDDEIEEDFGRLANDIRALYTFKKDVRVYALLEESAANVIALVEKPVKTVSHPDRIRWSYSHGEVNGMEELEKVARRLNDLLDEHPDILSGLVIGPDVQAVLDRVRGS